MSDDRGALQGIATLGDLVAEVDRYRLMADIRELARWTKHAGTETERRSLVYVERELRRAGFHTKLLLHDAYISLPVRGWVELQGRRLPGITHSFSRSSGEAGVTARLRESTDIANARSSAILIDGVASPVAAVAAAQVGAIAQIHVSPDEHSHEMCISSVWGSPDDQRRASLPTTCVVTVAASVGAQIRRTLQAGPTEVTVGSIVDTGWRKTPILLADLGSCEGGKEEPFVLFSGHHDTWHYGVMDNGGANATMLEVGRICAEHRKGWRRGLRIAFWSGHSQGRYSSSAWYADEHWEELERRAVAHVNVDSTGGVGNTLVSDTTSSAELSKVATEALMTEAGQPFNGRRMQRAGDQSFWGIGVPSIFGNLSERPASSAPNPLAAALGSVDRQGGGTGWWWHTPDDTQDKIDPQILARDTRIYLHVVWRLLCEPILPLDYATAASRMVTRLLQLQSAAGQQLDLSEPIQRAKDLALSVETLLARIENDREGASIVNPILRRLSRLLVPIDYTLGDRFAHDPALTEEQLPALADIPKLRTLRRGSDEWHFLRTRLVRERNRVGFALREALDVVASAISSGRP